MLVRGPGQEGLLTGGLELRALGGRGSLPILVMSVTADEIVMSVLGITCWPLARARRHDVAMLERTPWPRSGVRVRFRDGSTSEIFRTYGTKHNAQVVAACQAAGWYVREALVL